MISRNCSLIPLERARDPKRCGGKAYNLGRLCRAGYSVPPGAVILDVASKRHLVASGVWDECRAMLEGLHHLPEEEIAQRASVIRTRIVEEPLDERLRRQLARAFRQRWQDVPLAVRSSAIAEDGVATSFAGQLDTILDVQGLDALEVAVRRVWSSQWSDRCLFYARRNRTRIGQMGVIIQEMAEAIHWGVIFSRDPTSKSDDANVVIEYVHGRGDRLVAGQLTPHRVKIDRHDYSVHVDEMGNDPSEAVLPNIALRDLAHLALRLEQTFRGPQDIEWCIDRAGRIVVLQSRPITPSPASALIAWSNANIAENFPEPVSPLLASIVCPGYSAYFRGLGSAFGISRKRMAAMGEALDRIVGVHAGRLYYNLSNIHTAIHLAPFGRWLAGAFNDFTGAIESPVAKAHAFSSLRAAGELVRIGVRTSWHYLTIRRRISRFGCLVDQYAAHTVPSSLPGATSRELLQHIRHFLDIRLHRWTDAGLADVGAMVSCGMLKRFLARHLGDESASLINDLLTGLPNLVSTRPVSELWRLSRLIREDPELLAIFRLAAPAEILATLNDPRWTNFRSRLGRYLNEWGFRYSRELMLNVPTPVEKPEPIIHLLQVYASESGDRPEVVMAHQVRLRVWATKQIVQRLKSARKRRPHALPRVWFFRLLLRATHAAICLRERARMKQALLYTRLRHVLLASGICLVRTGVLPDRDDIFYLTIAEVQDLLGGAAMMEAATGEIIASRKRECAEHHKMTPPDSFALPWGEQWSAQSVVAREILPTDGVLRGSCACGGQVDGPASVLNDVTEAGRIQNGQILVTRQMDPAWATVFLLVKGLVIERGGLLSHGAIIAREYGIPTVIGVRDATSRIRDGDRLTLDGDAGLVTVHN